MAEQVGSLYVAVGAQVDNALNGLEKVKTQMNRTAEVGDRMGNSLTNMLSRIGRAFMTVVGVYSFAQIIRRLADFAKQTVLVAARTDELRAIMEMLGKRAGYTSGYLNQLVDALKRQGIESEAALHLIAEMIRYEVSLSKALEFATVAQNAATFSARNSTEALEGLLHAVLVGNPIMARTQNVIVNFRKSMDSLAESLGKTRDDLTDAEAMQARFGAVLQAGGRIAGAYAEAMTQPIKRMRSLRRLVTFLQEEMGAPLQDAFGATIDAVWDFVVQLTDAVKSGGEFHGELVTLGEQLTKFAKESLPVLLSGLKTTIGEVITLTSTLVEAGNAFAEFMQRISQTKTPLREAEQAQKKYRETVEGIAARFSDFETFLDMVEKVTGRTVERFGLQALGLYTVWRQVQAGIRDETIQTANQMDIEFQRMESAAIGWGKGTADAAEEATVAIEQWLTELGALWDKAYTNITSEMGNYYQRIAELSDRAFLDDVRATAEHNAEKLRMIAEGRGDELGELDRSFKEAKILRDLDNQLAMIQLQAKHRAEMQERIRAFAEKMAWWVTEHQSELQITNAQRDEIIGSIASGLGAQAGLFATFGTQVMGIVEAYTNGTIDSTKNMTDQLSGLFKNMVDAAAAAGKAAAAAFQIDRQAAEDAINKAYAKIAELASKGVESVGAATEKSAEQVVADMASTLDRLFSSIRSIMETIVVDLPELPAEAVGRWLNQLYEIADLAARWLVYGKGRGLLEFINEWERVYGPQFKKWAEQMQVLSNVFSVIRSISSALATELKPVVVNISEMFDQLLDIMWAMFSYTQDLTRMRWLEGIMNAMGDLSDWFKKISENLGPLGDALSTMRSVISPLTTKLEDVVVDIPTLFDRITTIMWAMFSYTQDLTRMRWFEGILRAIEDLGPWFERISIALKPLSEALSAGTRLLDAAAVELEDINLAVPKFFENLLYMLQEFDRYLREHPDVKHNLELLAAAFDPSVGGSLGQFLEKLADSLKPLSSILSIGTNLLNTASKKLKDIAIEIPQFFTNLEQIVRESRDWIQQHRDKLEEMVSSFGDPDDPNSLYSLLEKFAEVLGPLSGILSKGSQALQNLAEKAEPRVLNLDAFFEALKKALEDTERWLQFHGEDFKRFVEAFAERISPLLEKWTECLGPLDDVLGLGHSIMGHLGKKVKKLVIPIIGFLNKLLELSVKVWLWVVAQGPFFTAAMEAMRDAIVPPLTAMKEALQPVSDLFDLVSALAVEEGETPPDFGKIFEEVVMPGMMAIVTGLKALELYLSTIAFDELSIMLDAVREVIGKMVQLVDFAAPFGEDGISRITQLYQAAQAAGKAVAGGLIVGMVTNYGNVYNAAYGLGLQILKGLADALGMHSESKVMKQMGEMAQAGFYSGFGNLGMWGNFAPAPVLPGGRRGGPPLTIEIKELYGTDREAAKKFAEQVARELRGQGVI